LPGASRPSVRWVGLAVAIAAVAVFVAFSVLGDAKDASPPDPYLNAVNRLCRSAGRKIERVKRRHQDGGGGPALQSLAKAMFLIPGVLHDRLLVLTPPREEIARAVEFEAAVYESEAAIIALSQLEPVTESRLRADAKQTEAAGAEVRRLASSLGLDQCARLEFGISPSPG
jgi:hypothetical protein